jgi:hypothetical protein
MQTVKNTWRNKPSVIFLVILFVLLIFLLLASLLIRSEVFKRGPNDLAGLPPTETATGTTSEATEAAMVQENTPTPTRVLQGVTPGTSPTNTPVPGASPTNTPVPGTSPTPTPPQASTRAAPTSVPNHTPTAEKVAMQTVNVLRNGGFESGMDEAGIGLQWNSFTNGGAKYIFAPEAWPLAVYQGDFAQRITIYEAHQPDRYAGLYQRVYVVPDQKYTLTLHGQIRSKAGDIQVSQYGYRMQYAIDWHGGTDWTVIPAESWIELPWDEQLIDGPGIKFFDYSATIAPPHNRLTLFIRAWNKWPDPVEAQYTLDTLSLIGPSPGQVMIGQALPITGTGPELTAFFTEPRFWASLIFLIFLIGTALWRHKYRRRIVR